MATILIVNKGGDSAVAESYYATGGLAVTRTRDPRDAWQVTHLASGRAVSTGFSQRRRARAFQQALLTLAVDWSQARDTLRALPDLAQHCRALRATIPT